MRSATPRELQTRLATLEAASAARDEALAEKTEQNNALTGQVNALTERNNALTGQVNGLTERNNTLTGQVNGLTEQNNALTGRVNGLTEQNNALTGRVQALSEEGVALTEQNHALTTRLSALTGQNNSLTTRLSALTGRNNSLTTRLNALTGENNALTARLHALTEQTNSLTTRLYALTTQNNDLTGRVNDLCGQVNALTQANNELAARSGELEAAYGRFRALVQVGAADDTGAGLPERNADEVAEIHSTLVDAPLTHEEAIVQAARLRLVNTRVKDGYYTSRLVVLTCIEKSGSTTHEICVREMLRQTAGVPHDIGIQKTLEWGPFSYSDALYPEVLLYALDGGILRAVLRPTKFNLDLLRIWACKHLILFRHPADRIVGRYCDPTPAPIVFADGRTFRRDPQYLMSDIFAEDREMEEVFEELLGRGYLWDTLCWMADWLHFADRKNAKIVHYETMAADPIAHFDEIHRFLFGSALGGELERSLEQYVSSYRQKLQPGETSSRRYPRGYSGLAGIAQAYFSKRNLETYRLTVDRFLAGHPHAKLLLDHYPDLRMG